MSDTDKKLEDIENLVEAQTAQFDKYVLTLASGLFGLSIAFLKDVAGENPTYTGFVVLAWVFLGLSIGSTLLSFLTSIHALRYIRDILIRQEAEEDVQDEELEPPKWTLYLNWFSYVFFFVGTFMFCVFSMINMGN